MAFSSILLWLWHTDKRNPRAEFTAQKKRNHNRKWHCFPCHYLQVTVGRKEPQEVKKVRDRKTPGGCGLTWGAPALRGNLFPVDTCFLPPPPGGSNPSDQVNECIHHHLIYWSHCQKCCFAARADVSDSDLSRNQEISMKKIYIYMPTFLKKKSRRRLTKVPLEFCFLT